MMIGWWEKNLLKKDAGKQNASSGAPRKLSFSAPAEPTIMMTAAFKSQDGAVKMDGAYRAAQEAMQRAARGFLFVYEGPASGTTFFLERAPVTVGRHADDCDFALNDPLVSRIQCKLQPTLGTFRLVDSESKNGTRLNDQPVTERELVNGDQIAMGSSRIYVGIL